MAKLLTREKWAQRVGKLPPGDVLPEVPGLVKQVATTIEVKNADPSTGMSDIKFTISTAAIDRESDVISTDGWELDQYRQNPVVLYGHDYGGLPVARAVEVELTKDALTAVDRFTPREINPFGYMVYQMIRGKFLNATSVGFRPLEYVYNEDHKGYDFMRQELLEHSVVPVPANPEALQAASAEGIDLDPLIEWAEKILDDPSRDRVALWLPRETVEAVRKAAGAVAPTQIETSTTGGIITDNTSTGEPVPDSKSDDQLLTPTEEAQMEESIKALTEVVRLLQESLDDLPEKIAAKITESMEVKEEPEEPTKTTDDDDVSEEDVRAIARAATEEVILATTGKLPE